MPDIKKDQGETRARTGLFQLKFADPALEKEFQDYYTDKTIQPVRVGLVVGVVIYALFFLVDLQKVSDHALLAFFIRFALITPLVLGVIGFSYKEGFRGLLAQALLSTLITGAGASVLAIDYISDAAPQVAYYAGMMLVVFVIPLGRLLFSFALGVTFALVAMFVVYLGTVLGGGLADSADKILMMVSAAALSLVVSYFSDQHTRREFALIMDLERSSAEAVAATQMKDKLVALVSHDLKDPLSSIKAVVDIMKNFGDDLEEKRKSEMLESLEQNVDRMREIIHLLMRLKGIQAGELLRERKWISLRAVADKAVNALSPVARRRKVDLANDVPLGVEVFADEALLAHAIQNLVSNAVRYTDAGGKVRVSCPDEPGVTFAVKDSGRGMDLQRSEEILSGAPAGATAKTTDGSSGWGIGLSIINEIVSAHGGSMWVKSQPGSGAVFYVRLPDPGGEPWSGQKDAAYPDEPGES